ncbi:monofunctional biosynthetic peptidoglycan transglycosylase [Bosea sp. AAP35]|nr:monofunctional biosynthetic peptidoglycan transglycosylase [Bosea sp. AAP35]
MIGRPGGMTAMAAERATTRRSLFARLLRWFLIAGLALLAALVLALILYRFVPVPSTLMLGRWLTLQPVERQWVPLAQISPNLIRAVIAAEDQRFCSHDGVDWVELNAVLEDEDGPSRGASTLTMQTAKNVFLWPGRSYVRKGLEIPLAMTIDVAWPKQRIIEIYLNVAEWGEGLYGAEAAAQRYFGKPASRLSATEAARLAGALPNPILRNPARPSRGLQSAAGRVQRRVGQMGPLGDCAVPG